ncbi:DUF5931 domain-containing protein [Fodinicola feengrottensis]|uniref:DUF5931 domain-containing protein n=1 Tax=Fodinicola feengrottensis TaxID=435914 RepID=UPI0024435C71|nr:DUF5931 domain-containing protein [Fodinicola feengrottensis]
MPARTAAEIADAVRAALDNVRKHVGADAPAWLLVEDTGDEVVVTVRDDGPGIPAGRLEQAVAGGAGSASSSPFVAGSGIWVARCRWCPRQGRGRRSSFVSPRAPDRPQWTTGRLVRSVRPALRSRRPGELEASLWRAVAAFRVLALIPAAISGASLVTGAVTGGWVLSGLLIMTGWTVVAAALTNRRGSRRTIASGDLVVAIVVTLMSVPAAGWQFPYEHSQPLAGLWVGCAGLSWALSDGALAGVIVVGVNLLPNILIRGDPTPGTLEATVLYLLAAGVVGYAVGLVREAEQAFAEGVRLQAATAERERLAREVHDGVLQVLALMSRKGEQYGGELADLGRLAGEQESALRKLVQSRPVAEPASGTADLKELLVELMWSSAIHLAAPRRPRR